MGKKLMIFLIVLGVGILLSIGTGIYFYKFYSFKTLRVCISGSEVEDLGLPCSADSECLEVLLAGIKDAGEGYDEMPDFIHAKVDEVLEKSIYCETTCKQRNVYGDLFSEQELGSLKSCEAGDEEVTLEIKGKEGVQLLSFLKERA